MKTSLKKTAFILTSTACLMHISQAAYMFAEWGNMGANYVNGTINGIGVHYNGQVAGATQIGNTGAIDYWLEYPGQPLPYTPVTGSLPPRTDVVALSTVGTFSITFDQPVLDPAMLICSLGDDMYPTIVSYTFDQPVRVLTSGYSYWTEGPTLGYVLAQDGNRVVVGQEGSGVIAFEGMVSQITWTTDRPEYWHGFTLAMGGDGENWHNLLGSLPPVPSWDQWSGSGPTVPEAPSVLVTSAILLIPFGLRALRAVRRTPKPPVAS